MQAAPSAPFCPISPHLPLPNAYSPLTSPGATLLQCTVPILAMTGGDVKQYFYSW